VLATALPRARMLAAADTCTAGLGTGAGEGDGEGEVFLTGSGTLAGGGEGVARALVGAGDGCLFAGAGDGVRLAGLGDGLGRLAAPLLLLLGVGFLVVVVVVAAGVLLVVLDFVGSGTAALVSAGEAAGLALAATAMSSCLRSSCCSLRPLGLMQGAPS
jgi:hypothetical protein